MLRVSLVWANGLERKVNRRVLFMNRLKFKKTPQEYSSRSSNSLLVGTIVVSRLMWRDLRGLGDKAISVLKM